MTRQERINRVLTYHKRVDEAWAEAKKTGEELAFIRKMVLSDVYFLLYYVLERKDVCYEEFIEGEVIDGVANGKGDVVVGQTEDGKNIWRWYRPFLFERCREIQLNPDGYLDIWARDHYKSTCITYALTLQEILKNPEITICIYSYNISTAQKMLVQVKNSLQSNSTLQACFPDVLFTNVNSKTYRDVDGNVHKMEWGDDGFVVRRKTNPKEKTLEASGLVTGQKTGGHYQLIIYDDTVTPDSVTTAQQIQKTTTAFMMSINTGSTANMRIRMIGTFYAMGDTYAEILKQGMVKLRRYSCWDENHEPALYTKEALERKLRRMNGYVQSTQMECNPQAISDFQFKLDWIPPKIDHNSIQVDDYNWYIIVDPAMKVSNTADYTVMWVIGTDTNKHFICADLIRDKLDLEGKQKKLFELVNKYTNKRKKPIVWYERVAMQSDVNYIQIKMNELQFRFELYEASGKPKLMYGTSGGSNFRYKDLRIQALQPLLREGRIHFIDKAVHTNYKGIEEDMLESFFTEEYVNYPNTVHDDGLDSLARLADLEVGATMVFPNNVIEDDISKPKEKFSIYKIWKYKPY